MVDKGFTLEEPGMATSGNDNRFTALKGLTGEMRYDFPEEAKVAIRNVRRDANKSADQAEKAKDLSEDDRDACKEEVQELTKKYEAQVTESAKARETEVMED